MNTLIRQRTATGTEFENIIDADPVDVQAERDRVDGRGMMIVRDRRSDEPSRTTGLNRPCTQAALWRSRPLTIPPMRSR